METKLIMSREKAKEILNHLIATKQESCTLENGQVVTKRDLYRIIC
jgi:hypothetical protein